MSYDTDPRKLSPADRLSVKPTPSLDALFAEGPEAIITAVPPGENNSLARIIAGSEKVKGVLFEKPLADTTSHAESLVKIMAEADKFAMIGLTGHGFYPEFRKARQVIERGTLGTVHTIIEQIHQGGPNFPQYYLTHPYGGVIKELGIHTLDHLDYLTNTHDWQVVSALGGMDPLAQRRARLV
jgi:predicted dehydrogenase